MTLQFTRATRAQVPLKLGITGPSGSGKTTAALKLTRGLVGPDAPIAFLDTENGSASLYADITAFDVLNMAPPYQVAKFVAAIDAATQAGFKALVIDSASAEWQELLTEKEALDARGGNSFANWGSITKKHEDFLKAVRNASIHLILCLRSKQEHVQDKDANGRTTIRKVGMAAIQREGAEYELTTVFELAMDHNAKASKDRTGLYEGRIEPITEATGRELATWLSAGKPLAPNTGEAFAPLSAPEWTDEQKTQARAIAHDLEEALFAAGLTEEEALAASKKYRNEIGEGTFDNWSNRVAAACARKIPTRGPIPTAADVTATFTDAAKAKLESAPEVSPATDEFVDGLTPLGIDKDQYEALGILLDANGIDRDRMRAYAHKAGHLLPSKTPTLARMKVEAFIKFRTRMAGTQAAKTASIINATPIPGNTPLSGAAA